MPKLIVETNQQAASFRQRFARRVSLWLRREGIDINHVIVKFYERPADSVYSGPYAFDQFPHLQGETADFAFVTCDIDRDRPRSFRERLAHYITDCMKSDIPPEYIFIKFQPVDPADFYVGQKLLDSQQQQNVDT